MIKKENKTERNEYLDFLKGVLIFLVIYGHSIQFIIYGGNVAFYQNPIFKLIYIFHMPLFMMVSGYVSYYSIIRKSFRETSHKRFNQLIVPIITWALIINIFKLCYYQTDWQVWYTVSFFLKSLVLEIIYSFWFLWCVFGSVLLVVLIQKFKRDQWPIFVVLSILLLLMPDKGPLHFFKYMFPFFCIGYCFSKFKIQRPKRVNISIAFLTVLLSIVCFMIWDNQTYIYISKMVLSFDNIIIIIQRYFSGFILSIAFIIVTSLTYSKIKLTSFFPIIGRNSLAIFILQTYLFMILKSLNGIKENFVFMSIVIAPFIAAGICVMLHYIGIEIKKYKFLGKFLIGQI